MTSEGCHDDVNSLLQLATLSLGLGSPFLSSSSTARYAASTPSSHGSKETPFHVAFLKAVEGNKTGSRRERTDEAVLGGCNKLEETKRVPWRRQVEQNSDVGEFPHSNGCIARMSGSGVGGSSQGRTMRAMFNDMMKRHSRIIPLGPLRRKSPSADSGNLNPDVVDADNFGSGVPSRSGPKKVLILMSDTGGGHRASAEAIKQAIEEEFGDNYKVTVIDLWKEHTPWPFNQMPKSYSFLVKHETLWKVAFHVTKPRFVHQPQMAATSAFVAREVSKGLDKYEPDVIVSVHPLMQHIPLRVLRKRGMLQQVPFTTVITDLTTCHPTWFHKLATLCFCPTKDVAQRAFKAGLKANQIRVHGLPIRPAFCKPVAPKDQLRSQLGMDLDLPAVLLMGGGEGMGPVESTARALAVALGGDEPKGQLIVICGRNAKLHAKLSAIEWPMPVLIQGFVTNMPEWMAASDCIITKAGPGTIAEALIRGLPLIINDFIAGQEVGNVPFVVNNGAGKFSENPKEIAKIVADWFGPNIGELREMSINALKLSRPDAVFKIVRDLDELARRREVLVASELALAGQAGQI